MRHMAYLVSFALLVALGSWIVGVYNNLEHLRGVVCNCWGQWRRATHRRNECLNDYVAAFAVFMPVNSTLPHDLRRMVEASESSLALAVEPRWSGGAGVPGGGEWLLRRAVAQSLQVVEETPVMRGHEHLQRLCSSISVCLYQQDQVAASFNHAARAYNEALASPSARLLAPLLGFARADALEMREARSS